MKTQRTLVVGPSWIGDMVMAQSLFITLRRRDPEIRIDVVAPGWSRAILARMPEVGEAIEVGVRHGELGLKKRRSVGKNPHVDSERRELSGLLSRNFFRQTSGGTGRKGSS